MLATSIADKLQDAVAKVHNGLPNGLQCSSFPAALRILRTLTMILAARTLLA